MLLGEALILGLVGTAIGLPAGLGGAHLLADVMTRIRAAPLPRVEPTASPFVLGAAVGIGMAPVAAYFPARIAGRIMPVEGMRPTVSTRGGRLPAGLLVLGLAVYAAAAIIVRTSIRGYLPIGLVLPSGVVLLMASVILIAALLTPLAWSVGAMLAPMVRVESVLARRQLMRRRSRTILTIGVLYLAVATGVGLGTTIVNNVKDVRRWYRQTMVGDFFLTGMSTDPAAAVAPTMLDALGEQLRAIPGVTGVSPVRMFPTEVDDLPVVVIAGDFAEAAELPIDLEQGDPRTVARRLAQGEVVIGTTLAQRTGLHPGQTLTLQSLRGPVHLTIAATMISYNSGGLVLCIERSVAHRLLGLTGADLFVIRADPSRLEEVRTRLAAVARDHGLLLHSLAEVRRMLDAALTGVVGSLWSLLILGFVVAAFGVANTLAMNVLEQTREIALLRVVGMTRGQVRKTILTQAGHHGRHQPRCGLGRRPADGVHHQPLAAAAGRTPDPVCHLALPHGRLSGRRARTSADSRLVAGTVRGTPRPADRACATSRASRTRRVQSRYGAAATAPASLSSLASRAALQFVLHHGQRRYGCHRIGPVAGIGRMSGVAKRASPRSSTVLRRAMRRLSTESGARRVRWWRPRWPPTPRPRWWWSVRRSTRSTS